MKRAFSLIELNLSLRGLMPFIRPRQSTTSDCFPRQIGVAINKRAFSLIELMIGVAIIGILAAIVLPLFQSNMAEAKEAAAKDDLRILRSTIEFYAAQNESVPPGYAGNNPAMIPTFIAFKAHLTNGGYLRKLPTNPFNNLDTVRVLSNYTDFPAHATGQYGWIYKPSLKAIKLDWIGTDSKGIFYYDY